MDGHLCDTFHEACQRKGLLQDNGEWALCLQEASITQTGSALRSLFATMLLFCQVEDPAHLWEEFKENLCDDLERTLTRMGVTIEAGDIFDYGLYLIDQLLFKSGSGLHNYPTLPKPTKHWENVGRNRLIMEQRNYDHAEEQRKADKNYQKFNPEQKAAFHAIIDSVMEKKGQLFFLNGPAGTGKTFVYNVVCSKLRANNHIVLCVASSGIAALLLPGGRTSHSRFKIPLKSTDTTLCNIPKQSMLASLIRETSCIIWDEVPMQNRYDPESVDRSLQDIRDCNKPFGGITVVFGGDFQQILPVILRGSREQIVWASLKCSPLWSYVQELKLKTNMRLEQNPENHEYADWLLKIGNGSVSPDGSGIVKFPSTMKCPGNTVSGLIDAIYPSINVPGTATDQYLLDRTILCPKNDEVNVINGEVLQKFPGVSKTFLSADSVELNADEDSQYPTEFINGINSGGIPLHKLELKKGVPVMLLRNLSPGEGLCNGTRLVVTRLGQHILEARIIGGQYAGNIALIPRIMLSSSDLELPFKLSRRQFPVRVSFAMSINKSQGQSVRHTGIDLRIPVFTHGQLYVALSRSTSASRDKVLFPTNVSESQNIVYPEVL